MTRISSQKDRLSLRLLEALGSSLDIRQVLRETYPLLTRLVPADYGALGVSASAKPEEFEWTVAELPPTFFAAYPEMAAHDFVRSAVIRQPNHVLRDQDMVSRSELERNMMYRRAREVGVPIEQVMAVMLHVDERWQSGLSLYRERRKPFSALECARLQSVTPALANAVRNCHLFGMASDWKAALERLLESPTAAIVLAAPDGSEVARSERAAQILERWFDGHECRAARLPRELAALLAAAPTHAARVAWRRQRLGVTLEVSLLPLTGYFGDARFMLRLEEQSQASTVPEPWRGRLTTREQQVVSGLLQGWDNRLIGEHLGCAQTTVKKHLQRVFEKLGVESRTALMALAAHRLPD